jgi:hydroxypyruvate reductase
MNLREVLRRAVSLEREALAHVHDARQTPAASFDLIALGKSSAAAVDGVLEAWGDALVAGLVVLPEGASPPREDPRVRVLRASHPLPDARSVAAGLDALALAGGGEGSELHVHVSGGASSLAAAPIDGVSLDTLRDVTRALLVSGAEVRAINVVRRHLSKTHGGGLARAAWPRPTRTIIVSDVIGGAPHDVGSGPASPDPTTIDDARRVLERYAPSFRDLPLVESLKPGDREAASVSSTIGLEPQSFADVLAMELKREKYSPRVLPPSTDDVARLADEYVALARTLAPGDALVRCAEPTLRIDAPHPGAGGRCTHIAALVARDLAPGVAFIAAATDGVDGSSGTGGAIVEARSFLRTGAELDAALAAFDTGTFHRAHGTALPCGPTGLNFADLHALVRARAG